MRLGFRSQSRPAVAGVVCRPAPRVRCPRMGRTHAAAGAHPRSGIRSDGKPVRLRCRAIAGETGLIYRPAPLRRGCGERLLSVVTFCATPVLERLLRWRPGAEAPRLRTPPKVVGKASAPDTKRLNPGASPPPPTDATSVRPSATPPPPVPGAEAPRLLKPPKVVGKASAPDTKRLNPGASPPPLTNAESVRPSATPPPPGPGAEAPRLLKPLRRSPPFMRSRRVDGDCGRRDRMNPGLQPVAAARRDRMNPGLQPVAAARRDRLKAGLQRVTNAHRIFALDSPRSDGDTPPSNAANPSGAFNPGSIFPTDFRCPRFLRAVM